MTGHVCIITNRKNGALYTGVTADIPARMMQHGEKKGGKFAAKYDIFRLVYMEEHADIRHATSREKPIKKRNRAWKIKLITSMNPDWRDLFDDLNGGPGGKGRKMGPRLRGGDEGGVSP
jgi:putative endonuclease